MRFADHPTVLVTPVHSLVAINRNRWSRSIGTPGRNQSEPVVAITRYAQFGQRVVEATFLPQLWKQISRKLDWQAHTGKARGQLRQAGLRAINDQGQVIGSARWFGCLSATVDPHSPLLFLEDFAYCNRLQNHILFDPDHRDGIIADIPNYDLALRLHLFKIFSGFYGYLFPISIRARLTIYSYLETSADLRLNHVHRHLIRSQ
jgi:hypothetical protein